MLDVSPVPLPKYRVSLGDTFTTSKVPRLSNGDCLIVKMEFTRSYKAREVDKLKIK